MIQAQSATALPEIGLAEFGQEHGAVAVVLMRREEQAFRPATWWADEGDARVTQARLLLPTLLPGLEPETLALRVSALPAWALLEGETYAAPELLLREAGVDEEAGRLLAEVAGVRFLAVVPIGPRATIGLAIAGFAVMPVLDRLREHARSLGRLLAEPGQAISILESVAAGCGGDVSRLYRIGAGGLATVAAAWPEGASGLPEAGESLGLKATGLESVVESEDIVLLETGRRSDWLSALQAAQGLTSVLFAPLFRDGRVVAVIEVAAQRAGVLTPAIAEQVQALAPDLLALLGSVRHDGELPTYELVRALMASPAFGSQERVDRICLEVLEPDRQNIRFVVGGNGFLPGQEEVAPLQGSATQDVLEGGPAVVDTSRVNGWFNRALLAQGLHSVLRVPVRYQDEILGVLSLASRTPDAFEDTPDEVRDFVEHLSLLVAAESRRGRLLEDERRAQVLAAVAAALTAGEVEEAFEGVSDALASVISCDALWFGAHERWVSWPRQLDAPPAQSQGESRVAADLSLNAADGLESWLHERGYRSLAAVSSEDGTLVVAALRAFAFDAGAVGLIESTAGLLGAAAARQRRRQQAATSAGLLRDSPDPLLTIDSASGLILDANDPARDLLDLPAGEINLWTLVPTYAQPAIRDFIRSLEFLDQATTDAPLITRSGRRLTLELHGRRAGGGLVRIAGRDVSQWRAHERLRDALQRAALAAQGETSQEGLDRGVIEALAGVGIEAHFAEVADVGTVDRPADESVHFLAGAVELRLGDTALYLDVEAGLEDQPAIEMLRLNLLAVGERLAAEAELRAANSELAVAVADRTRELEGLFAFSRDLAACEDDRQALIVAAVHASEALGVPVLAEVCLDGVHLNESGSTTQARSRLRAIYPDQHDACDALPPDDSTDDAPITDAVVQTGRGDGLLTALSPASAAPGPAAVKLLLTHATQLGETLDRLATRRAAEESRLRSVTDSVSEGIALAGPDDVVTPENEAARQLLAQVDQEVVARLANDARQTGAPAGHRADTTAGRKLLITATPMSEPRGRVALTLRDITEQHEVQERLAQAEKLAALGQLVSGVAHELNNPLTGILGFAQLLQDSELDDNTRRGIQTIQSEAERAGKIIQDLLSFARRRTPSGEPLDINALLSQVLDLRAYDLKATDIELETSLAEDLPGVAGDADQLLQVFFNVLTNAIQAAQAADPPRRIRVETALEPPEVVVTISDSGTGIAAELQGRVFEPFFTTKPPGAGTGLGLSISYGIVEDHGGTITIANEAQGGAIVQIRLPASEERPPAAEGEDEDGIADQRRRILVVDDEESIRDVLRQMLSAEGHIVEVAPSGAEALTKLSHRQFDLVISDLKMPEISGQELYGEIVASDPEMAGRVIFITGDTVNEETRAFIDSVENPTLEKPFRLEALRDAIERSLE